MSVWGAQLDDLRAALRRLPEELAGEAANLVAARANGAASTIKGGYPSREGDLIAKLTVAHTRSRFGARSVVTNTSTHALPFEVGSEVRSYTTKNGVRHLTGRMPANPLFTQTVRRARRAMYGDLTALLERHGLTVTTNG